MNILVTGAAGFIGRHVVSALRGAGHHVIPLDARVPWDDETGTVWIQADITKTLDPIPGLDAVVHLAAVAAPRECDANPTRAFDVNVNGTLQVLRMALASGAKKVVFSSSAHVYGISPRYMPTDETHPLSLGNTYTTTKILGEQLCELYWENHGLAFTTLRLFNAYGENQGLGYFIPDQLSKAAKGGFELRGSNVTKDWVHVSDVADAFVRAVESPYYVGALNVGTGVETDLGTIAGIIAEAHCVDLAAFPVDSPTRMCGDIGRIKRILGWTPKTTLREGLDALVNSAKAIPIS